MSNFIFVGEKPSNRAMQIGATWENGKLAGKTLRQGLLSIGLDPDVQRYMNLWGAEPGHFQQSKWYIRYYIDHGYTVVAMGQKVGKALTELAIPHIPIVHPAARGTIRKTDLYQAHLKEKLLV